MSRERGEGRAGCLLMLALMIVTVFVLYRTVPVMLDKLDFVDQLERIASEGGAKNWTAETVKARVLELARVKQLDTTPEEVKVMKAGGGRGGELRIDVSYRRTIDLSVYYYTFKFHTNVNSFVGTL